MISRENKLTFSFLGPTPGQEIPKMTRWNWFPSCIATLREAEAYRILGSGILIAGEWKFYRRRPSSCLTLRKVNVFVSHREILLHILKHAGTASRNRKTHWKYLVQIILDTFLEFKVRGQFAIANRLRGDSRIKLHSPRTTDFAVTDDTSEMLPRSRPKRRNCRVKSRIDSCGFETKQNKKKKVTLNLTVSLIEYAGLGVAGKGREEWKEESLMLSENEEPATGLRAGFSGLLVYIRTWNVNAGGPRRRRAEGSTPGQKTINPFFASSSFHRSSPSTLPRSRLHGPDTWF